MRLVNCSKCFRNFESKFTTIVDGKRVCDECKSNKSNNQLPMRRTSDTFEEPVLMNSFRPPFLKN
jgi:NAD-dependent SIR2 family protein deacetylase